MLHLNQISPLDFSISLCENVNVKHFFFFFILETLQDGAPIMLSFSVSEKLMNMFVFPCIGNCNALPAS